MTLKNVPPICIYYRNFYIESILYHFDLYFSLPWNILGDVEALLITALSWDIGGLCLSEPGIVENLYSLGTSVTSLFECWTE